MANEGGTNPYAGGFMFFRYLAQQSGDLTLTNFTSKTSIQTFNGNDSIYSVADSVTISTSAGNDYIFGFNETSTLSVVGGDYFDFVSGKDKIFGSEKTKSF